MQGTAARALDIVLPPRCLSCGLSVGEHGQLCASCWAEVSFIAPPLCAACGTSFVFDGGEGALCGACIAARPLYGRARAVMRYDDGARALLAGFLIRGDQQRGGHALRQAARSDDASGDRPLHIHAAQPMQHTIQDARRPGRVCPACFRHRIHMAGQRITAARAAMRDQGALGHPLRVCVVQAFDLEPR